MNSSICQLTASAAMAPRQRTAKATKVEDRKKQSTVPKYMFFAKSSLAPYPDEAGNPLYSGDVDAIEFLEPKAIAKSRTTGNCEYLHRPGMALSLAAAALNTGFSELQTHKGKLQGAEACAQFLKKHPDLLKSIKVLDTGKTRTPDTNAVEKAVGKLVDALLSMTPEDRKGLADLVISAGRFYIFAMNALETQDLMTNPKIYARKLEKATGRQSKAWAAWLKSPEDADKKTMLSRSLDEKVQGNAKKQKKSKAKTKDAVVETQNTDSSSCTSKESSAATAPRRKRKPSASSQSAEKRSKHARKPTEEASPLSPESSSNAEDESQTALLAWEAKEIQLVARDVNNGLLNYEDKKKRLTLAGIVALLDNIPTDVLKLGDLLGTQQTLKAMSRLPKPDQVKKILTKMQDLFTRALGAHGLSLSTDAEADKDKPEDD